MTSESTAELRARIQEAFNRNRSQMTLQLARTLGCPEAEIIRHMPDNLSVELNANRWEEIIRAFEPLGSVHVIVSNASCTLEAFGQFGNFSVFGDYFNVQTKNLDMHIRFKEIAAIFAVEKPGHLDRVRTLSFQFYNGAGCSVFKVFLTFGGKQPPAEKVEQFEGIRERFRVGKVSG